VTEGIEAGGGFAFCGFGTVDLDALRRFASACFRVVIMFLRETDLFPV
jgi:hypothetical protein